MFVDSHCHLEGPRFQEDRAETIARARAAGVEALLAIGNGDGPDDMGCAIALAEQFDPTFGTGVPPATPNSAPQSPAPKAQRPRIFATVGVHPHEAKLVEDRHYSQMESLARNERVVAIGEIGLDYHYDHSPRDVQKNVFLRQCELASAARLPIVIHCRASENTTNAWDELLELLREAWAGNGLGGVLHCFTGTPDHARAAVDLGFMISFAGNVTYPKSTTIQQTAKELPLDRMLIETDSPYLAPVPYRGKRNEPAFVVETAKFIAALRGVSSEEIGRATTENFRRFFGISQG
ncbi:MAG: TatD family hydrolase [Terriglobales bacterium]